MFTLNVDMAFTVFHRVMPLMDLVCVLIRRNSQELSCLGSWSPFHVGQLEKQLRGVVVIPQHRRLARPPAHKIIKLTRTSCANTFFERSSPDGDAETVSVAQYFKEHYNLTLRFPHSPCLVLHAPQTPSKQMFLPMEVCHVAPAQRYTGKLSEEQTSTMIKQTAVRPQDRFRRIKELASSILNLRNPQQTMLDAFGVKINTSSFIQLTARLLPPPMLEVGSKKTVLPKFGQWNIQTTTFHTTTLLTSIAILNFTQLPMNQPPRTKVSASTLYPLMQRGFAFMERKGVYFNPKKGTKQSVVIHDVTQASHLEKTMTELYMKTGNQFQHEPELLFFVFPKKSSEWYSQVKKIADTVLGVPSQVLLVDHIVKCQDMYWTNVALKVNIKAKPASSKAMTPESNLPKNFILASTPKYFTKPFMLLGADVTHPSPGLDEPSIAGVVASVDKFGTRYLSITSMQSSRQEEMTKLKDMMLTLLKGYHGYRQCYPERLLFYRDGVSEGQFDVVKRREVPALLQAYKQLGIQFTPAITFVIVQKRHHTRFLAVNDRDTDMKSGNLPSGLLVDEGIVHPTDFDFYLQSQQGLMGTCRPTHYQVIHDDYQFAADELYMLTYHCCFLYARCPRAVRIVTPVYYAHLLCFRARYRLSSTVHEPKSPERRKREEPEGTHIKFHLGELHSHIMESMYFL